MANARPLLRGRLRGPDVHAAVDEHRVDGDDLHLLPCSQALCDGDAELGLPRGGRSDERTQRVQERTPGSAVRPGRHQTGMGVRWTAPAAPLR